MNPSHIEKLEQAKEWLGQKWVCHPVNRVKKLKEPIEPYVWKPKILRGKKWLKRRMLLLMALGSILSAD